MFEDFTELKDNMICVSFGEENTRGRISKNKKLYVGIQVEVKWLNIT